MAKLKLVGVIMLASAGAVLAGPVANTVVTFDRTSNGANPLSALVADAAGNLYGTTNTGGADGDGTVFEIAASTHILSTLMTFDGTDGANPAAGLVFDSSGNLYGTTSSGGTGGQGTVFKIAGGTKTFSTLATFNFTNGASPEAGLIVDASGNLYGTTNGGGTNYQGTVFKIAAGTNALSTLVTFDETNGSYPAAGLIADASGNLYGTTTQGGMNNDGTVFKIAAGTHTFSTVVTFDGTNGSGPQAGLIADAAGNLYGTTGYGGTSNDGTVFKIAAGTHGLNTLAVFDGTEGQYPSAGLIADAAGNLYGTAFYGGSGGEGTVFEVAAGTDTLSALATFDGDNGAFPMTGLIADATGDLYGTTFEGGADTFGTVFEVTDSGFVVPEPASLALCAVGGLVLLRRRVKSGSNTGT
jgi:uncharacterized repeat protein (TIGR03803 family)